MSLQLPRQQSPEERLAQLETAQAYESRRLESLSGRVDRMEHDLTHLGLTVDGHTARQSHSVLSMVDGPSLVKLVMAAVLVGLTVVGQSELARKVATLLP